MSSIESQSLKKWLEFEDFPLSRFTSGTWITLKFQQSREHNGQRTCTYLESMILFDEDRAHYPELSWHEIRSSYDETTAYVDGNRFFVPGEYFDYNLEKVTGLLPVTDLCHEDGDRVWDLNQEIVLSLRLLRKGNKWIRPSENFLEVAELVLYEGEGKPVELRIRADVFRDYLKARSSSLFSVGFSCREYTGESTYDVDWEDDRPEVNSEIQEWNGFRGKAPDNEDQNYLFGKLWWKNWVEKGAVSTRISEDKHPDQIKFFTDRQSEETKSLDEINREFQFLHFEPNLITTLLKDPRGNINWFAFDFGKIGIGKTDFAFGVNELNKIAIYARDIRSLPHWFLKKLKSHNIPPEGGIGKGMYDSYVRAWFSDTKAPEFTLFESLVELEQSFQQRYGCSLFTGLPEQQDFLKRIHRFNSDSEEEICLLAKELNKIILESLNGKGVYAQLSPASQEEFKTKKIRRRNMLSRLIDELGGDGREAVRALAGVYDLRQLDAHSSSSGFKEALAILGFDSTPESLQPVAVSIFEQLTCSFVTIRSLILSPQQSAAD